MGKTVGGRFKREGIYVYLWLIHVDVWQKPSQYFKVIILQLKIKCTPSCFSCVRLYDFMDCSLPGSSVRGDSPGKNAGVGCRFLLQGLPLTQGLNCVSYVSCIGRQVLYQLVPPGKPSGVGSHSLLQGIFPSQGSNLSLLHCRHIL